MIKSKTKHRCNADLHTVVRFSRFYKIVSRNFTRSANWPALLFILAPLLETEPVENTTLVMEPAKKKFNPTTAYIICLNITTGIHLFQFGRVYFAEYSAIHGVDAHDCF